MSSKTWTGVAKKVSVLTALSQLKLAVQQRNDAQFSGIVKALEKVCPQNNQLRYFKGLRAWQSGQVELAFSMISDAYGAGFERQDVALNLAQLANDTGRTLLASKLFRHHKGAISSDKNRLEKAFDIATNAGELADAGHYAELLIELVPTNIDYWEKSIDSWQQSGHLAKAAELLDLAINLFPLEYQFLWKAISVNEKAGNLPRAKQILMAGNEQFQSSPTTLLLKSILLRRERRAEDAISELKNVSLEALPDEWLGEYWQEQIHHGRASISPEQTLAFAANLHPDVAKDRLDKEEALVDQYLSAVDAFQVTATSVSTRPQQFKPLFIVGFPRCGSTLTEKLIHQQFWCINTDECIAFDRLEKWIYEKFQRPWWELGATELSVLREQEAEALLKRYYTLSQYDDKFAFEDGQPLIDKNLTNMLRLPLIQQCFPEAPIVKLSRDPYDTVLSCFLSKFAQAHPWQKTVYDTARHYIRLEKHWKNIHQKLPNPVFNLSYEDVVSAGQLPSDLVEFLEQYWSTLRAPADDQDVRRFNTRTASYAQVENSVNRSSMGFSESYKDFLTEDVRSLLDSIQ